MIDRLQPIHRLQFQDDKSIDNQIKTIAAIQAPAFVADRQFDLPLTGDIPFTELPVQTFLVY